MPTDVGAAQGVSSRSCPHERAKRRTCSPNDCDAVLDGSRESPLGVLAHQLADRRISADARRKEVARAAHEFQRLLEHPNRRRGTKDDRRVDSRVCTAEGQPLIWEVLSFPRTRRLLEGTRSCEESLDH